MKPSTVGIAGIIALGALTVCSSALAQDNTEPRHSFGCSTTEAESTFSAELNHPSNLQFVAVVDTKEIQQAQSGGFHTLYSRIDAAKYKINRIDFYVHQERPQDPEQSAPYSPLTIYVRLGAAGQFVWWKVAKPKDENPDENFLSASVGADAKESPVTILPATGDRTIPMFDVQWSGSRSGAWSDSVEAHLLLDFRLPSPKIGADLSCHSVTAFGACGVYDAGMQPRNTYQCDWIAANNDFRCEATIWNQGSGARQTKSWFELLSGKDIPFPVPPSDPATLQQFAEFAERDPSLRLRQVELPGLGKTSDILRMTGAHNRVTHILGTYGDTALFGARFFYVILSPNGAPELGYVPALSLLDDDPEDKLRRHELEFQKGVKAQQKLPTPANQIDTGTSLSFAVKELFAAPPTHIYQVTAREETSRAVYWLAIDDDSPDGKPQFGMTKVAGNGSSYAGCAQYRSEASAAVITRQKARNFRALIDVEPSHTSSETSEGLLPPDPADGKDSEDQCPYSLHLEWNHKEWFRDQAIKRCGPTFSPRTVTIDDDGNITATRAQIDNGSSH